MVSHAPEEPTAGQGGAQGLSDLRRGLADALPALSGAGAETYARILTCLVAQGGGPGFYDLTAEERAVFIPAGEILPRGSGECLPVSDRGREDAYVDMPEASEWGGWA